jgi:hypothetical protein
MEATLDTRTRTPVRNLCSGIERQRPGFDGAKPPRSTVDRTMQGASDVAVTDRISAEEGNRCERVKMDEREECVSEDEATVI